MKLRITEDNRANLHKCLAPSFIARRRCPETGCILLVQRNESLSNPSLLVVDVLQPRCGDFDRQGAGELTFSSRYLRRALMDVRERGLSGFLTVHTHPFANEHVRFSTYDDANDPELMANLYDLQLGGTFGSVVAGKGSLAGRLWSPSRTYEPLTDLITVGEGLKFEPLDGSSNPHVPPPSAIFDRALALTGAGALARLSSSKFCVVGASGTGSLMIELLMRAGAGEILLFEFDHADDTNLNRVLHLRRCDAQAERGKAERFYEVVNESGLPVVLTVVTGGDIRNPEVAERLRDCDLLLGCVDRDWPRLILSQVAYQYLIPYIDLGTEIGLDDELVQSLDARVSYVAPGRPCLLCSGVVTEERVALEGQSEEELDRILGMGYSRDFRLHAPAVMDLNMRAASQAGLLLRHLFQSFLLTPLPHSIRERATNFSVRKVNHEVRDTCPVCGNADRLGSGPKYRLTTR